MSPWEKLLERPHSRGHFVQLYQADDTALVKNVGHYLWEGLRRGDGVLVIATREHQELFSSHLDRLGANLRALLETHQLVFWDAQQTLVQFMAAGQPDWQRFENVIRSAMRQVHPAAGSEGLRAYGEMVGILWKARQFAAAIRLEQLWNRLLEQSDFSLYCAYAIDVFGKEFDVANLEGVLSTHTHLVPSQPNGALETALNRSIDEVLGPKADALRVLIKTNYRPGWAVMPTAEAIVLWLRKNLPEQADYIIERARYHYQLLLQPAASQLAGD
jgi:KaiC/GvpD/RAD55 family RecA-like ATPase